MKSFQGFITERKARNYGTKGGQGGTQSTSNTPFDRRESRANMQDPSRSQTGGKPKRLGGKTRILPSSQGPTYTNMPEPSRGTTDEVIDKLTRQVKDKNIDPRQAKVRDTVARLGGKASPELQRAQSTSAPENLVGQGAKPGRGRRYRQTRPAEVKSTAKSDPALKKTADKIIKDLRADAKVDAERASAQSRGTASRLKTRMSSGVDALKSAKKELADKASDILKQTREVKPAPKPTPAPTAAPKPTVVSRASVAPKVPELPKVSKTTAPPPLPNNRFLRKSVQPKVVQSPVSSAPKSIPAPTPDFRSSTPTPTPKPVTAPEPSVVSGQDATNRAVRRAIKQSTVKPQIRSTRTLAKVLKGAGYLGTAAETKGEFDRRVEQGQSRTTAAAGAATRTSSGLAAAKAGGIAGAKVGKIFGPKGALIGGAVGSVGGYIAGSDLGTRAFDAVKNFDYGSLQKKIQQFRKLDHKKYSTF